MTYLVFDVQTTTGYLFETRHKWLAHAFCVVTDFTRRIGLSKVVYDYDDCMDFGGCADDVHGYALDDTFTQSEAERDWNEIYNHA